MSRKTRSFGSGGPNVRPVQKIELSDINIKRRLIIVALLFVLSVAFFGYGINQLVTANKGWQKIETSTSLISCGDEFVFTYNLGAGQEDATTEKKKLILIYSDLCVNAYNDFCNDGEIENVHNIYYINQHPNEEIEVSELLYRAFETVENAGNRLIYLAPVYDTYDDMFSCVDDGQAKDFDPYMNEEILSYYQEIATYAKDSDSVRVELLGDNKIKLVVSEEYEKYAEGEYISSYIDFFWMRNAFACDYIAEGLIEAGYTAGAISSFDGFTRCLDNSDTSYSYNILEVLDDREDGAVFCAANNSYSGQRAIVDLRNYMYTSHDSKFYYKYSDGQVRTSYIDIDSAKCKSAKNNLVAYSKELSCADILMEMIPVYIADQLDLEKIDAMKKDGIFTIYNEDTRIICNDSEAVFEELYDKDGIKFTIEQ